MEWINVKDRLPDHGVGVLVTDGQVVTAAERRKDWSFQKKVQWTGHEYSGYEWEFDFDTDGITHWMPLPEPPT